MFRDRCESNTGVLSDTQHDAARNALRTTDYAEGVRRSLHSTHHKQDKLVLRQTKRLWYPIAFLKKTCFG
jgi:hypothetical protein